MRALPLTILPFNPTRTAAFSVRAGLSGYYFRQLSENEVDGVKQRDSHEQVLGVGPGAMWVLCKDHAFWLNTYFETAVQNRFAGAVFQGRWARTF
jgi:hypothetical protein